VWEAWTTTLPSEAATDWRVGAAYVRESSAASLGGDAPDVQLRNTLALLARKQVYVPRRGLFFDVQSGTDASSRPAFQRLFEEAIAGGFKVIGVFVSERLFRNVEQSIQYKRTFAQHGIELEYTGKFEGDQRSPSAWQLEVMTDMAAELHARNTGYYIGRHFELISRQGRPVGGVPEVYHAAERAPRFMGRGGAVIRWELTEPLASVLKEGAQRYLEGESFQDLALWSANGVLQGKTPRGRQMNKFWWRNSLFNPVHAGYTVPTEYTGFRPGKISAPRRKRRPDSELVPSVLPALWDLETYERIVKTAKERHHAPKDRTTYRQYLISGLAYDPICGHPMRIALRNGDRFSLRCLRSNPAEKHGPMVRADVATQELDALIGMLVLDDPGLVALIDEELSRLTADETVAYERFVPDPAIGRVRAALTALGPNGMEEIRAGLQAKLDALLAIDEGRRQSVSRPVAEFRAAIKELERWREVWKDADVGLKNRWLRAAGIRVTVGRDEGQKPRTPAHILSIESSNPVFHLALQAALEHLKLHPSDDSHSCESANGFIRLRGGDAFGPASLSGRFAIGDAIPRPVVSVARQLNEAPRSPRKGFISTAEYARRSGLEQARVWRLVHDGRLRGFTVMAGRRRWMFVLDDPYAASCSVDGADPELTAAAA